jgi:hypothetical protein
MPMLVQGYRKYEWRGNPSYFEAHRAVAEGSSVRGLVGSGDNPGSKAMCMIFLSRSRNYLNVLVIRHCQEPGDVAALTPLE